MKRIDRADAEVWAGWFRALADPTRILILHRLARAHRPLTVGEIVDKLDVGQSTVSYHLRVLADVHFVMVEHKGTASLYRINEQCLTAFPPVAQLIASRLPAPATLDALAALSER